MNIIEIYKNYLFALREREEYGELYGDTEEIIKRYEEILENNNIKVKRLILENNTNKKSH